MPGNPLKFKKIQINKAQGNKSIPDKTKKLVKEFYQLDSVSRQAPGRKDFVSVIVKDEGKKHIQKRHLFCSLKETYAMFVKDNPTVKIGFGKFCSLRPINVMLSSKMPRDVCLCSYHENIKLLCQCLNKEIPQFPVYSGSFVENFVCNSESESCMLGKCNRCPKWLHQVRNMVDIDTSSEVEWCQWERVEQMTTSKKEKTKKRGKTMKKICKLGTVDEAIQSLKDQMPYFLQHVYVKRQQSAFFDEKKANLTQNEALVQVDFAENYTCKHQDEVQSAHWHQQKITLFTVAVWTNNGSETTCKSHVIVTDELSHEKKSVAVMMPHIIDQIVKNKAIRKVHVFSVLPPSLRTSILLISSTS